MSGAPEIESLVGQSIGGKYRLTRVLGAGGMGAVYEAVNTWTDRRVALKLMLAAHAQSPGQIERFLREARAAGRIDHPNIVQVLDVGQSEDGAFFLVQEFLAGQDLRAILDEAGRMSPRETRALLAPVMSALAAAHAQGVVHRDIKPDNIFVVGLADGTRTPKVIDFGIAKLAEVESAALSVTRTGTAIGTPLYMSPEQARGAKTLGPPSDVWSLGVVMFECLAGRCPVDGESYNEVIARLLTERPPRLDHIAQGTPRAVADIVAKALEPATGERFRTMEEFLAAVKGCKAFESDAIASVTAGASVRGDAPTIAATAHAARVDSPAGTAADVTRVEAEPGPRRLITNVNVATRSEPGASGPAPTVAGLEISQGGPPERERSLTAWVVGGLLVAGAVTVAGLAMRASHANGARAADRTQFAAPVARFEAPVRAGAPAEHAVAPRAPAEF
ncbi:MAG: serine/threonine-protein kinase, partial [Deltaproteobacteria bacterium]